jgi:phosphoribosylformylglycinamidine cyclo-ligase
MRYTEWYIGGGAQTKILHFVENLHIIKTTYFLYHLFQLIQEQSKTDWKEMYQVLIVVTVWKFTFLHSCTRYYAISKSFNDAQIVGRVEAADSKKLTISSEYGVLNINIVFVFDKSLIRSIFMFLKKEHKGCHYYRG